jgi:hypothetical protein
MARLRNYATPTELYRYRSLSGKNFEQEMDAIENSYLWCSEYKKMNDPMEGIYDGNTLLTRYSEYEDIVRDIADEKTGIGICSFSEVLHNEVMWAHYADQFR